MVHTNGSGFSFHALTQLRMSGSRAGTVGILGSCHARRSAANLALKNPGCSGGLIAGGASLAGRVRGLPMSAYYLICRLAYDLTCRSPVGRSWHGFTCWD